MCDFFDDYFDIEDFAMAGSLAETIADAESQGKHPWDRFPSAICLKPE